MTTDQEETPGNVLDRLLVGCDPRRARSLRLLHEVCEAQHAHGSRDYSLATLGRLLGARGGPNAASLGNPSGKAYRTLIAAHRAAHGGAPRVLRSLGDTDELLAGVRDPTQRARIEDLRDQVRSLRRQVADLQRLANTATRVAVSPPAGQAAQFVSAPPQVLLGFERDALRQSLNPLRLKRLGLVVGRHGRLETQDGVELFPVGFATALQKLMALSDAAPVGGSGFDGPTESTR